MKKLLAILIVSVVLAGCAKEMQTFSDTVAAAQNFKVTQGQVDASRNSYDGFVLGPLHKYALLPRCKTGEKLTLNNPCHDRKLLKQIRTVDIQVEKAFNDTQNRITSGDNQGAVAAYTTLKGLIDIAKALIAQTGVTILGA